MHRDSALAAHIKEGNIDHAIDILESNVCFTRLGLMENQKQLLWPDRNSSERQIERFEAYQYKCKAPEKPS